MKSRLELDGWLEKNMRHSIRGRYAASIIVGVLATAAIITLSAAIIIHLSAVDNVAATMDLHCRREGDAVNDALSSVEQAVIFMQNYAQNLEPDIDLLMSDEAAREDYVNKLLTMFKTNAPDTEGCMSYFFRFNPEDFSGSEGFLYSLEYGGKTLSDGYSPLQITPIDVSDADNEEYEWFFKPIALGNGLWITPHYMEDLKMSVITYVEPVYVQGKVVGVVGMDLDFDNVLQKIGKNRLYTTGTVFLVGSDGKVMGVNGSSDNDEVAVFADTLVKFSSNGEMLAYHYNGRDKRMVYCTLTNAMKLVITANATEIFGEERRIILEGVLFAGIIALIFVFIGFQSARRITRPLRRLAEATSQITGTNFTVALPGKERDDEIGELARTLQNTMDTAQEYADYIEGLAYKDALTGLNNKAAYDARTNELDEMIKNDAAEFAIVMVDLNFLKKINDEFGHGVGNQYINRLCDKIIAVFPEKDIYRIGGDEFVVILTDEMYEERNERIEKLRDTMQNTNANHDKPWKNVSAAVGMSDFIAGKDGSAKSVFDRADEDMYERKVQMKAVRE